MQCNDSIEMDPPPPPPPPSEDEGNDEDLVKTAEEEFWETITQERKQIENKEKKRQEALMPKGQPTPIPEEEQAGGGLEDVQVNNSIIVYRVRPYLSQCRKLAKRNVLLGSNSTVAIPSMPRTLHCKQLE